MGKFDNQVLTGVRDGTSQPRYFTAEEANRSLVLVGKVVKDIVGLYCRAKILEERYSVLDRETERRQRRQIRREYETLLRQLQSYSEELNEIGCQLKDWQMGIVNWPAIDDDRHIYLCWRLGEDEVNYYHEAYENFPARKRLTDDSE